MARSFLLNGGRGFHAVAVLFARLGLRQADGGQGGSV
jgi:hypothetical protein